MPNNTGLMLLAGLGALLFLGRGGAAKKPIEDMRKVQGGGGMPMPPAPAFDIQSYIDGIFGETADAPIQPPVTFFQPRSVVVTSSGVPGVSTIAPQIITPTTKVAIGGDGGETITASAVAVRRSEQIVQQEFEYSVTNVQPRTWDATIDANRIEEARQKKYASDLIAKYRAQQIEVRIGAANRTREAQESAARINVESIPPTIIAPGIGDFSYLGDDESEFLSTGVSSGGAITVSADVPTVEVADVAFAGEEEDDVFVISGGMDSPFVDPVQDYYGAYGGEE